MKILIIGVPGTGKTTLGDYFSKEKGFFHQNMEDDEFGPVREFKKDEQAFLDKLATHGDTVATWGFGSFQQRHLVERMRDAGFMLFWLDGDRVASFRTYMHREKHDDRAEYEYYGQMHEIIATDIVGRLAPVLINPFTESGEFRPIESVAEEIITRTTET